MSATAPPWNEAVQHQQQQQQQHQGCGFEGPEKRIEVDFEDSTDGGMGLRILERKVWDDVVASVNGVILNSMTNKHFDAYLISESSMFVYPTRVVMLTCGTTTLLNALPHILAAGERCNLRAHYVQFSRKNFIFPQAQIAPHRSFEEETRVLKQRYSKGSPFVMGPLDGDHWYCFIADYIDKSTTQETDQLLTIYMHDLDEEVAKMFIYGDNQPENAEEVTKQSGISALVPEAICQGHCFDGCGYSVNAMIGDCYFTMHITPESHCSYASFETNLPLSQVNDLVRRVLRTFRPRRTQTVLMYDADSPYGQTGKQNKRDSQVADYVIKNRITNSVDQGSKIIVTNYRRS